MTLKSVGSVLTRARNPLPHWRQSHQSHSDAVEIPLRKLDCISCQRSAARRSIGANPEDDDTYCDVTTLRQTRHLRF